MLAQVPQEQTFTTRNGLRVILQERHDQARLCLHLRVDVPPEKATPAQRQWLMASLRASGAGGQRRTVLERRHAERGMTLVAWATADSLAWTLEADIRDTDDAFELLAHDVFRPALEEAPVSEAVAFRATLGFPVSDPGPLTVLERFALHRRLVRPEQAVLIVRGDLGLAQAKAQVLLHLGTWAPSPEAPLPNREFGAPASTTLMAGSPSWGDAASRMLGTLVLQARLKDDPSVVLETSEEAGPWLFHPRPGVDEPAFLRRLENLAQTPVSSEELNSARRRWKAQRTSLPLHPREDTAALAWAALHGDPAPQVEALTPEALTKLFQTRLTVPHLKVHPGK
ncbi:MAG: hypothetical protein LWX11_08490 [Firmicutes bacterium]|nr:hypothetical protein [Bacillota bacterium]